jgi:hypothetical protein
MSATEESTLLVAALEFTEAKRLRQIVEATAEFLLGAGASDEHRGHGHKETHRLEKGTHSVGKCGWRL